MKFGQKRIRKSGQGEKFDFIRICIKMIVGEMTLNP